MEKLLAFLKRLEVSRLEYRLEGRPWASGISVHTWVGSERWVVDFSSDGRVEAEVFRSDSTHPRGEEALENLFGRMRKAWLEAAHDLGIRFESPFELQGTDGRKIRCTGLLPDFGGPRGAVITSREDPDEAADVADALGYYNSGLNPRYYEDYDRARFIELLRDWGWHGPPGALPEWMKR